MSDPTQVGSVWRVDGSDEWLAANLEAIAEYDAELATRIESAEDVDLEAMRTPDGGITARWNGRGLASARAPVEEAERLLESVDPERHAVVVAAGFGLGVHIVMLARRFRDTGVVVVYETDLPLLRAVLNRLDPMTWSRGATVRITDRHDPPRLARLLGGHEPLLMIGTTILEHPPSRARLGDAGPSLSRSVRELVANTRMTMNTTLLRCTSTLENQLGNLERYALGSGIDDLRDAASGRLGVVVSAGPSLRRNIADLAAPGVRDRCLIVATQTTLKPLLAQGVAPHYVVALDYHEISRRFYEGIDPAQLRDTELVIDTKVNPAVPGIFPGRIRTIPAAVLDRIVGRESGGPGLPASSTVAHLAYGLARHLGCDPVALIGQDLGFTDGLYYAAGNAIHDVWTPEFNDFNTVETMEWERIARHRPMLSEKQDVHGRRMFTDAQMLAYLQRFEIQFEADVAAGLRVIDATEGGIRKRSTEAMPLEMVLAEHAASVDDLELPRARGVDASLRSKVDQRLAAIASEAVELSECSFEAGEIIGRMIVDQRDTVAMQRHFDRLNRIRRRVDGLADAPRLADSINQAGAFRRLQADRRIRLAEGSDEYELQRRELDRDLVNTEEMGRSSTILSEMLDRTRARMAIGATDAKAVPSTTTIVDADQRSKVRVVAIVPIDPDRGGTGVPRRLEATFGDVPVLQRTLERLGTSEELAEIVMLAPSGIELERLVDRDRIGLPVRIEYVDGRVFPVEHEAVRLARAMHPTSWRGGLQGLTIHDEVFAPRAAATAFAETESTGAVFVGPDWPVVTVHGDSGIDALVRRHRTDPTRVVFVQGPPGLGSALVPRHVVESVARRSDRDASIGAWLGYRPEQPVGDPISGECCLKPEASVRNALGRYTFDTPRQIARMRTCFENEFRSGDRAIPPAKLVSRMERRVLGAPLLGPQFVRVELCTGRRGARVGMPFSGEVQRAPMTMATFRRIVDGLGEAGDTILIMDGLGDPLLHPRFDEFATVAIESGIRAIRLRTDLAVDPAVVDRLLGSPIAAVEVDLDADRREVYERVHGVDMFETVCANIDRLIAGRRILGGCDAGGYGLPWVVPRIERREETIDDIPEFFERWRRRLGVAVIDGPVRWPRHLGIPDDQLLPTRPTERHQRFVAATRVTVLADGAVPFDERDVMGAEIVGRVQETPLRRLWRAVTDRRQEENDRVGGVCASLRA